MKFPKLLVVIHETVVDCPTLLTYIQSPNFGASYHACIDREGCIIYLVPSYEKAFAAARSSFTDPETGEVEQINGSVDDFAYHIALESPEKGQQGYTEAQYKSLAWLISKTGVSFTRVVTHGEIKQQPEEEPKDFYLHKVQNLWVNLKSERVIEFGPLE